MSDASSLSPEFATLNISHSHEEDLSSASSEGVSVASLRTANSLFYVILKGSCPGIFSDPHLMLSLLDRHQNAHVITCPDWFSALTVWCRAISQGDIKALNPPPCITWVVIRGHAPGIYHLWNTVHRQIHGLPYDNTYYHVMESVEAAEKAWMMAIRNNIVSFINKDLPISEKDLDACMACLDCDLFAQEPEQY